MRRATSGSEWPDLLSTSEPACDDGSSCAASAPQRLTGEPASDSIDSLGDKALVRTEDISLVLDGNTQHPAGSSTASQRSNCPKNAANYPPAMTPSSGSSSKKQLPSWNSEASDDSTGKEGASSWRSLRHCEHLNELVQFLKGVEENPSGLKAVVKDRRIFKPEDSTETALVRPIIIEMPSARVKKDSQRFVSSCSALSQ
eukprot:gb/GFBE01009044.1/.p1 GENE.gb/GFBE01009044.1/~~gb/GFBE01009044.1/.p1  ORF type:complete len:200 (+),score=27.69 gb/GFBE01009044.1/:1-600(+)